MMFAAGLTCLTGGAGTQHFTCSAITMLAFTFIFSALQTTVLCNKSFLDVA
jgi:hypothetical protein